MTGASRQLSLALPELPRVYPAGSYFETGANRDAASFARAFAANDEAFLVVTGSPGAGKTHLLHEVFGASRIVNSVEEALAAEDVMLALDDCAAVADAMKLLKLLERRQGGKTVLAGTGKPRAWALGLKDLETRLEAMPRGEVSDPDEALLVAVLTRHFAMRRLNIAKDVAAFTAPRIPRTFAAAAAFAQAAAAAAHQGASINVPLAKKIIENLFEALLQP